MTVYLIAEIKVTDDKWVPDYAPHGKARQEGAINSFQLIDDTDAAGTIPYLTAG